MSKLFNDEFLDDVRKAGTICLIDSGYGALHIYERLCDMLHKAPLEVTDEWIEEYPFIWDEFFDKAQEELPEDIVLWNNETGDFLVSTFSDYARSNIDDDYIQDIINEIECKIEKEIELRKRLEIENVENGEYAYLFENIDYFSLSNVEIVAHEDYYNHENEDTIVSSIIYDGEIEVYIEKSIFSTKERIVLEVLLTSPEYTHVCISNNGDSILAYDTFYLVQYLQKI
jgi:hypothetical protein